MKKIVLSVFTMLLAVLLVACGSKTYYAADGKYLGYEIKGTDLTTVEVTVVNDKITAYYIDVRQGKASVNAEGKGVITWNAKTKKELGNEYGMKDVGPGYKLVDGAWVVDGKSQKEWFEQAALIEAKFLADGIDAATLTDGRFDNIAGVTIKDAYSAVAKAALARWAK